MKKGIITTLAVLAAGAAALPFSLKVPFIKDAVLHAVERRLGAAITIDAIDLRWLSQQTIAKVAVTFAEEDAVITCEEIQVSSPLWKIILASDLENVIILAPEVTLGGGSHKEAPFTTFGRGWLSSGPSLNSNTNLPAAISFTHPFTANIAIKDGRIKASGIELGKIQASVNAVPDSLAFSFKGHCQEEATPGSIELHGSLGRSVSSTMPDIDINAIVQSLPVALLDKITSSLTPIAPGSMLAMLGPTLSMKASAKLTKNILEADANIQAADTSVSLTTAFDGVNITLKQPATFLCTVPARLISSYYPQYNNYSDIKVNGSIDTFTLAVKDKALALADLAAAASMSIEAKDRGDRLLLTLRKKSTENTATITAMAEAAGGNVSANATIALERFTPLITGFSVDAVDIYAERVLPALSPYLQGPLSLTASGSSDKRGLYLSAKASSLGMHAEVQDLSLQGQDLRCNRASLVFDAINIASNQGPLTMKGVGVEVSDASLLFPIEAGNIACSVKVKADRVDIPIENTPLSLADISATAKCQSLQDIKLQMQSSGVNVACALGYNIQKEAVAVSALEGSIDLMALGAGNLAARYGYSVSLAPLSISLSPCTINLTTFSTGDDGIRSRLAMDYAAAKIGDSKAAASCKDIQGELYYNKDTVQCLWRLAVEDKGISIEALKGDLKIAKGDIFAFVAMQQLPLTLLTALAPSAATIIETTGDDISGAISFKKEGAAASLKAALTTDKGSLNIDLTGDGKKIALAGPPATLHYGAGATTLLIDRLSFPQDLLSSSAPSHKVLIEGIEMSAKLNTKDIGIEKMAASASLTLTKELGSRASFEASLAIERPPQQKGSLQASSTWQGVYADDGKLLLDKSLFSLHAAARNIPAKMFAAIDREGVIASMSGGMISGNIDAEGSLDTASLQVSLATAATLAECKATISQGMLSLTAPALVQMQLTEQISTLLLKTFNPLSLTKIESLAPITLTVSPEGTMIPIKDFSLDRLTLPSLRLDLGQLRCRNEGNINVTLGLLRSLQLSQNDTLSLWFCPVDVSLRQGVATIDRFDVLIAELFNICLWGSVNAAQNNVDLVLGLTSSCLARAFSIDNLPEDYVLQIPMTGTLENVKLSTSKATAKIAALFAWQQATRAGAEAAGPAAPLLGPLLGKVAALPLNERNTPKAKRPFPWERDALPPAKKKQKGARKGRVHITGEEKPQELIKKFLR